MWRSRVEVDRSGLGGREYARSSGRQPTPKLPQVALYATNLWRIVVRDEKVRHAALSGFGARGEPCSASSFLVSKARNEPDAGEHADRPLFIGVDDDRIIGFAAEHEGDDALVAFRGRSVDTSCARDRERRICHHASLVSSEFLIQMMT